jgi:oligopeptide/dipeptide ABC transporter ATP-binding protein
MTEGSAANSGRGAGREKPDRDGNPHEKPAPLLLRIEDLTVSFGKGPALFRAVKDLSLELRRGECLGLVGESGSGKSVTALAIMGLLAPGPGRVEKGRILFRDRVGDFDKVGDFNSDKVGDFNQSSVDMTHISPAAIRRIRGNRIAMVFQDPLASLTPTLRVSEQMIEAVRAHRRISRGKALALACSRLEKMGIPDATRRIHDYPHQFSGGMCQRILIATALLLDPAILIADEPTTALDVTIQAQILDIIGSLKKRRGTAVLLITHDLGVVAEQTQRVLVIYAGRIVESASTEKIFGAPAHPYTRALLNSLPSLTAPGGTRIAPIPGGLPRRKGERDGSATESSCAFAPRCKRAGDRCRKKRPSLGPVAEDHLAACWFPEEP